MSVPNMWKMKCNILRFSSSLFHLEKLWTIQDASEAVVTALCVSKGMLWLGTSIGVILTLPLPRLRFVLLLHLFFPKKIYTLQAELDKRIDSNRRVDPCDLTRATTPMS